MPTLSFGGWAFGILAVDWFNQAKTAARLFNYDHLGANDAERQARIAEMMNRVIDEMIEANPDLARTTATYALPNADDFGENVLAIPTDMRGQDIITVDFVDETQGYRRLEHCFFIDNYGWQQLPVTWRNGTVTVRNPTYWTWDETAENLVFAPYPNDTTSEVQVTYRQKASVIPASFLGTAITGTVTTAVDNLTVTGSGTAFDTDLTISEAITIDETAYTTSTTPASATSVILTSAAQSTIAGAILYISRTIGEIPVRFQNVFALRLAAYLIEPINTGLFAELSTKFTMALSDMQKEITKQLAAWQARTNLEARPNQIFDAGALFMHQVM